jgi:hypothetical protein
LFKKKLRKIKKEKKKTKALVLSSVWNPRQTHAEFKKSVIILDKV